MQFQVLKVAGGARSGLLTTRRGKVATPAFMPVGTQGSVKAVAPDDLHSVGAKIILANTYHLYLRPGVELVRALGGLQRFMGWDSPILTDSGGFQAFSLGNNSEVSDEGVRFRSHLDGSQHFLTPERAVQYQEALGSDIAMVLDHCPAYDESEEAVKVATQRTHDWAKRCLDARKAIGQAMFGIVQGGVFKALREWSASEVTSLLFDGYAIGGVSVGEPKDLVYKAVAEAAPLLPSDKPRYLMGVGSPEDLVRCVGMGVDMFDCALPTRVARNGALYTSKGRVNIRNVRFQRLDSAVETGCDCYTCGSFSAAYLSHLFRSEELLYHRLATVHNLRFTLRLMEQIRRAIDEGTFSAFAKGFLSTYVPTDEDTRIRQKERWLLSRRAAGENGEA